MRSCRQRHMTELPLKAMLIRARRASADTLQRLWAARRPVVLVYHSVAAPSNSPLVSGRFHNVTPDVFRRHMAQLTEKRTVVPLDELAGRLRAGKGLRGLASITFDDGYRSVLENAVPILEEFGIRATLFLTTVLLDKGVLWRDKVRYVLSSGLVQEFLGFAGDRAPAMRSITPDSFYKATKDVRIIGSRAVDGLLDEFLAGRGLDVTAASKGLYCTRELLCSGAGDALTFGNHGHNHYVLAGLSRDEQREEIARGEAVLHELGLPTSEVFSVPFGQPSDLDGEAVDFLGELGYHGYVLSVGYGPVAATESLAVPAGGHSLAVLKRYMPRDEPRLSLPA